MPAPSESEPSVVRQAAAALTAAKVWTGRCLLELERNDTYLRYGCNSYAHYAQAVLRITVQEARSLFWVAERLEPLPLLSAAAEQGGIAWAALQTVLRCATPESEAYWLEMAQSRNLSRLERLVRNAMAGAPTGEENSPHTTRLIFELDAPRLEIYETVARHFRHEAGRPLTKMETWDFMCAELLAGRPVLEHCEIAAPWSAVAAHESPCPGNSAVQLVESAVPHWNPRARHTTPKQQAELLRRDGYRCSTPGCPHSLWLQVHHIVFYCRGGATVPSNLLVLCGACHRNLHRGWLRVTGDVPGKLTWTDSLGNDMERFRAVSPSDWLARWVRWEPGE